jgi:ferredoxin-thioredoxin reductase catalytic subunit
VTNLSTKAQQKRFEIIDRAISRGWFINPSKGMELYIDNILKFGYCPCDKTRPDCPCAESVAEVAEKGHCRCGLYWRSYQVFRDTLRPLKGEDERETKEKTGQHDSRGAKKPSRRKAAD